MNARITATILTLATFFVSGAEAQARRPMTIVDMIDVPSLSDPQLSPDGTQLLYVLSHADWDANRTIAHIWRVNSDGSDPVQLTNGENGESSPRWSPDGDHIAFLARRGESERAAWRSSRCQRRASQKGTDAAAGPPAPRAAGARDPSEGTAAARTLLSGARPRGSRTP